MAVGYDAIIIGAGHNGLVAGVYLARAGWKVLVCEQAARPGGAVASGEVTRPGLVHDLWSTNQNLFLGSAAYAELRGELTAHGLEYAVSDRPYASVFPGDRALRVTTDADATREMWRAHDRRDAAGWAELYAAYRRFGPVYGALSGAEMPSFAGAARLVSAVRGMGAAGLAELPELARIAVSSTRELGDAYFATPEAKALVAAWGMHTDFGPDVAMGAVFPLLEAFADMENGMAVVRGGASRMVDALVGVLRANGGELRTGAEVARVVVRDGRAVGVELADGERVAAGRAVIGNVSPGVLFGRLVPREALPARFAARARRFQYGPGTGMVHLALSGPVPWGAGDELADWAYVHVGPYVDDIARTYQQSLAGLLPDDPLLVVGQTTSVDPSRAPGGEHILWVQVRTLPSRVAGDALGKAGATDWDDLRETLGDRVVAKLERYAPGLSARVLDRAVFTPRDLERANPSLVGGDSVSGSHHLRQNLLFRPFPGASKYATPVAGLYMTGAATWPGAGLNATSGYLTAHRLLRGTPAERARTLANRARRALR
ncbi:MAG TPA: NAD(P)/FAD-dependent oxidoreductase [Streptosporangiaceae bacterium]|jgi:phytoene dehydrogenase-like protein